MSLLCEVQIFDKTQKTHHLRTALRGRFFKLEGTIPESATILLLVGVQVKEMKSDRPTLVLTPTSQVFEKPFVSKQSLLKVIELCSGMGCLGFGLDHAGFQVIQKCDINQRMLTLASNIHGAPTTVGDVCDDSLLPVIGASGCGTLAAGVACQPYSRLGDQRQECDPRSLTLPGVLRLAFLGRCGIVILECVDAAGSCPWVQGVVKAFSTITGYHVSQGILHLHLTWPTRRSRWWCILTRPSIGHVAWEPLPKCSPLPLVANLIDQFLPCTAAELEQLELDLYELRRFEEAGFEKNEVPWAGQMATSLHSIANQLMACPCGCRAFAFTDKRLSQGGLHSLLIRLAGQAKCGTNVYVRHRYIHPDELALLNGMLPGLPWGCHTRMTLCALGQLASPIQSTWVGSLVLQQLSQQNLIDHEIEPRAILLGWMSKLLQHRDRVFGPPQKPSSIAFQTMVDNQSFEQPNLLQLTPKPSAVPGTEDDLPKPPCSADALAVETAPLTDARPDGLELQGLSKAMQEGRSQENNHKSVMTQDGVLPMESVGGVSTVSMHAKAGHPIVGFRQNAPTEIAKAHAGQYDSQSLTPGIRATPGHQNALWNSAFPCNSHAGDVMSECAEPSPLIGNPNMPSDVPLSAHEVKQPHAGLGDDTSLTPGIRATPGHQNALLSNTSPCNSHAGDAKSECADPPLMNANPSMPSAFSWSALDANPPHAGPGDTPSLTPRIWATPGYQNAPSREATRPMGLPCNAASCIPAHHVQTKAVEWADTRGLNAGGTTPPNPCDAGPDDTLSSTPGIRATPGYNNALLPGVHPIEECQTEEPRISQAEIAIQAGHDFASALRKAAGLTDHSTSAGHEGVMPLTPGIRATPGYHNAHDVTQKVRPNPEMMVPSDSHVQPDAPDTPIGVHDGPGVFPAQTPGIRATPREHNALNESFGSHQSTHGQKSNDFPLAEGHQENAKQTHAIAGPGGCHPSTPGIKATPGYNNALPFYNDPPQATGSVCPKTGGIQGFASRPKKKQRCDAHTTDSSPHGGLTAGDEPLANKTVEATDAPVISATCFDHATPVHKVPDRNALPHDETVAEPSDTTHKGPPIGFVPPAPPAGNTSGEPKMISVMILDEFEGFPYTCQVPEGTTVMQITQAENSLRGTQMMPMTLVNTHLPPCLSVEDQQVIVFCAHPGNMPNCPYTNTEYDGPNLQLPCSRIQALWRQQAWVAIDEMEFFLEATMVEDAAIPFPPTYYAGMDDANTGSIQWLQTAFDSCVHSAGMQLCSAAIVANHWIPVVVCQKGHEIHFTTTPEGSCFVDVATTLCHQQGKTLKVTQTLLPQAFPADCGFQSLAWLIAVLLNNKVEPLSPNKAAKWRTLFARELLTHNTAYQTVLQLHIGGQLDSHEMQQLVALLSSHGVLPDRANERANQVASKVSPQTLKNILKSPRPWQDLKAAANNLTPPLKLIMSDELNLQIANRVQNKKYGKKPQTKGRRGDGHREHLVLTAAEVQVPHGVFRQQDGTVLGPVHINEVGPNASGILVVDQADCHATLRLKTPVTQNGLAVIVLATPDNADAHSMEPIRFPALCLTTQEPLIASGYMYQLGAQQVSRHEPKTKLAIEERQTETVRCLVYKDQAGTFWEDLQNHPVKHIFQAEPCLQSKPDSGSPVIDVWDRQWVSKKYEKVRPANAEVFMFSFRMNAEPMEELITKSGHQGMFWEPRSPCGRFPNPSYHVTWLQNMTFQDAKYAQQTSPQATSLARHGDRFGLRCNTMNAQEIHDKHRPKTPILLGQSKSTYMIGPLPYSTTREALIKLLNAWEWDAKPLQPRGRSQDGQGVNWSILATEDPGHWVYSLQHGDVLVSKVQHDKQVPSPPQFSIVASKKTIEHLQATTADPWLNYDPWRPEGQKTKQQQHKHVSHASPATGLTPAQMANLETNLEKRFAQHIRKSPDDDIPMEQSAMESRLSQLENQFQHLQNAQLTTDAKVSQVQHQIDQQSKSLGDRIDQRMSEQMDRIEQLLCKRGRHE